MQVRILGSAAGGGLPQWNCRCSNCNDVRAGSPDVQPRTQSSVAVSADGRTWFLLNVSADVRQQVQAFSGLWPPENGTRGTTIGGCILTDAEIDHASGLFQLREGGRFGIFSTALVHEWLSRYLRVSPVLAGFADRPWTELALDAPLELPLPDGSPSGLTVSVFEAGRHAPRYVPETESGARGSVAGLQVQDVGSGGKLVYAPGVESLDGPLAEAVRGADALLIDGTFWSDDEPIRMGIGDRTSRQMGHLPVAGPGGSLGWLAELPLRHRVYVHINNTNPMLNRRGREHGLVQGRGVLVGADGDAWEF